MAYRDETESLRAEVERLERENVEAQKTIARLRGEVASAGATAGEPPHSWLANGPTGFRREIELPYEISDEGFVAIARLLRERLGAHVTQVGRTLFSTGVLSLECEGGVTRVKLRGQWNLSAPVASVAGLAGILGGFGTLGVLADLATHGHLPQLAPLHALWIVPSIVAGAGYLMRRAMGRRSRALMDNHRGVFEALLQIAEQHAIGGGARVAEDAVKVRVEATSEPEPEAALAEPPEAVSPAGARRIDEP